ncbi:MAG TPA: hypothetical protein VFG69_09585 [Nannocystaceae bacterium]|nr:hypothetical protein [Nannocystaceae bacterium]
MRCAAPRNLVASLVALSVCRGGSSGAEADGDATAETGGATSSADSGTASTGDESGQADTGDRPGLCERPIEWTPGDTVGVPGGIADARTKCETAACSALDSAEAGYRDGTLDALALIQAAIESSEPETYVAIPAGTWMIGGGLSLNQDSDAITVRGAGMDETILDCRSTVCISVGSGSDYLWSWPETGNEITAGLTRGSTKISTADTSAFSVGQIVQIKIANDPEPPC